MFSGAILKNFLKLSVIEWKFPKMLDQVLGQVCSFCEMGCNFVQIKVCDFLVVLDVVGENSQDDAIVVEVGDGLQIGG